MESGFDPLGSYTGEPVELVEPGERPAKDSDDL